MPCELGMMHSMFCHFKLQTFISHENLNTSSIYMLKINDRKLVFNIYYLNFPLLNGRYMNFRKNNVLPDLFLSCTTQQVSEEAQELGKERTTPFSLGTNLIFLRLSKKKKCFHSLLFIFIGVILYNFFFFEKIILGNLGPFGICI